MNPNLTEMLKDQLSLPDEFISDDVLEWLERSLTEGRKISMSKNTRKIEVKDDRY